MSERCPYCGTDEEGLDEPLGDTCWSANRGASNYATEHRHTFIPGYPTMG